MDDTTTAAARVLAHAKVNLVLRVLAREASGYHGIETLFQLLELADTVTVETGDNDRELSCDGPAMPDAGIGPAEQNLAWRAASAYCDAARWPTGWSITIDKHIPVGGGLGGGSADAAAVLRALESMSPRPLGQPQLLVLAGTLGADVAFLTAAVPLAWGWGRGDRLLPIPTLPRMAVTLLTFDQGVSTRDAYAAIADARASAGAIAAHAYPLEAFASWPSIAGLASNDFEDVVPALHTGVARWLPAVRYAASRLTSTGAPAIGMMSGSGASCFILRPMGVPLELPTGPGMHVLETTTAVRVASPSFDRAPV